MAARNRPVAKRRTAKAAPRRRGRAARAAPSTDEDERVSFSNLSLHDLFQQQTMQLLDRTDLDEEQKQGILIAMSCPCCGAGGMSFTAKLKRRT